MGVFFFGGDEENFCGEWVLIIFIWGCLVVGMIWLMYMFGRLILFGLSFLILIIFFVFIMVSLVVFVIKGVKVLVV